MAEPVTVAEMRDFLRIDVDASIDASINSRLTSLISAARRACELRLNLSILGETRTVNFTGFPRYPYVLTGQIPSRSQITLPLRGGTLLSVTSVKYIDSNRVQQTVDPTTYVLMNSEFPAVISPTGVWPFAFDTPGSVEVVYVVAPMNANDLNVAAQAIRLLVMEWYETNGAVAVDVRGVPAEIPLHVTWLLEPLRVIQFR
jgi:uncharacterized phiE125 gp8 family phage protein